MLIAATADIHYPTHSDMFWSSLQATKQPDLLLLAGDVCEAWHPGQWAAVLRLLGQRKWECPVVAVWGNTEFENDYEKIKQICGKRIIFLNDEMLFLEVGGRRVGIVGSKGSLDQPTTWQLKNVPGVRELYAQRVERIASLLSNMVALKQADIHVLMTHYAPTYRTLKGESESTWVYLGCRKLERVIAEQKPSFVVHAHAHRGLPLAFVDDTPVFNVSLPANRTIVNIDPDKLPKPGLRGFV